MNFPAKSELFQSARMDRDFKSWWEDVKKDLAAYLQAKGELTKLQAYEKIARIVGVVISFLILGFLVGFVIIFLLLMLGSWIVELTGSVAIGISSVALLVIASFVFLLIRRKAILEKPITNRVLDAMFDDEGYTPKDLGIQDKKYDGK